MPPGPGPTCGVLTGMGAGPFLLPPGSGAPPGAEVTDTEPCIALGNCACLPAFSGEKAWGGKPTVPLFPTGHFLPAGWHIQSASLFSIWALRWARLRAGETCHNSSTVAGPVESHLLSSLGASLGLMCKVEVTDCESVPSSRSCESWLFTLWRSEASLLRGSTASGSLALCGGAPGGFTQSGLWELE